MWINALLQFNKASRRTARCPHTTVDSERNLANKSSDYNYYYNKSLYSTQSIGLQQQQKKELKWIKYCHLFSVCLSLYQKLL